MDIAAWLSRAILRIDMLLLTKATSNVFPAPQRAVKRLFILRYFPTEATLLIGAMQEHDLRRKTSGKETDRRLLQNSRRTRELEYHSFP